jgi:hypothetical protein
LAISATKGAILPASLRTGTTTVTAGSLAFILEVPSGGTAAYLGAYY